VLFRHLQHNRLRNVLALYFEVENCSLLLLSGASITPSVHFAVEGSNHFRGLVNGVDRSLIFIVAGAYFSDGYVIVLFWKLHFGFI
jgi:hypothetical protein